MIAETYFELLGDPGHWLFELTTDLVFGALLIPLVKVAWREALRRHDAEFHPEDDH